MKIAIAQINCIVGDLAGNAGRIREFAQRARAAGADVMLTPELSLCGYPPEDLLLRQGFCEACDATLAELAAAEPDITLVVGHPQLADGRRYNAASVLRGGRVIGTYRKQDLPNYTVFDEERYFESDATTCVFDVGGVSVAVNICEDVWGPSGESLSRTAGGAAAAAGWRAQAPSRAREAGAQVLLVLNASPYHVDKARTRHDVVRERTAETGMAVVFCNLVGGQDELVFDGASFAMNAKGELVHELPWFEESLGIVEFDGAVPRRGGSSHALDEAAAVYKALCLGVRDYVGKNGFPGALLGLSGGIDSALTLAIAADALGPGKVHAVMMPSQYTASMSREDAEAEAVALGVRYSVIPIRPMFDCFMEALGPHFEGRPFDIAEENLQSRIRGTLLMGLSNKFGSIVLTTGNKSEMGTGYATLYGDMAGGYAVLKDISKMLVYRLSRYRNTVGHVIPERVIERAPSAELRPDQKDQDSLPPYEVLDAIMAAYVEQDMAPADIVAKGYAREDVDRVVRLITLSEYKRRQSPVGVRITGRGFGKDWRYPITNRYRPKA